LSDRFVGVLHLRCRTAVRQLPAHCVGYNQINALGPFDRSPLGGVRTVRRFGYRADLVLIFQDSEEFDQQFRRSEQAFARGPVECDFAIASSFRRRGSE
jgi:hypothetical protein